MGERGSGWETRQQTYREREQGRRRSGKGAGSREKKRKRKNWTPWRGKKCAGEKQKSAHDREREVGARERQVREREREGGVSVRRCARARVSRDDDALRAGLEHPPVRSGSDAKDVGRGRRRRVGRVARERSLIVERLVERRVRVHRDQQRVDVRVDLVLGEARLCIREGGT
eukprot:6192916-Pleurochrysis_carterae.AAC.1